MDTPNTNAKEDWEVAFPETVDVETAEADVVTAFRSDVVRVASQNYTNSEGVKWTTVDSARYMYYDSADSPVYVDVPRQDVQRAVVAVFISSRPTPKREAVSAV